MADQFINKRKFKEMIIAARNQPGLPYKEVVKANNFLKILEVAPTEPVRPATQGHWIYDLDKGYVCSYCGKNRLQKSDFCPDCGSLMIKEDEEKPDTLREEEVPSDDGRDSEQVREIQDQNN